MFTQLVIYIYNLSFKLSLKNAKIVFIPNKGLKTKSNRIYLNIHDIKYFYKVCRANIYI